MQVSRAPSTDLTATGDGSASAGTSGRPGASTRVRPLAPRRLALKTPLTYGELLAQLQALAARLVDLLHVELFAPARELFGDRATAWIASTLRTTAAVLERIERS
jgi:hypothetical protein